MEWLRGFDSTRALQATVLFVVLVYAALYLGPRLLLPIIVSPSMAVEIGAEAWTFFFALYDYPMLAVVLLAPSLWYFRKAAGGLVHGFVLGFMYVLGWELIGMIAAALVVGFRPDIVSTVVIIAVSGACGYLKAWAKEHREPAWRIADSMRR